MITVSAYQDKNGRIHGFRCVGHAGYAKAGYDIICAAVSVLATTTVNAIHSFTSDVFSFRQEQEQGLMDFKVTSPVSAEAELLLRSMFLGLSGIEEAYGGKYIHVKKIA